MVEVRLLTTAAPPSFFFFFFLSSPRWGMWSPCLGEECAPPFGDLPCLGDPWCAPGRCKALCFFFSSIVEFGLRLGLGLSLDSGLGLGCNSKIGPTDLSLSLSSPRCPRAASAHPGASRWATRDDLPQAPNHGTVGVYSVRTSVGCACVAGSHLDSE